jgi:hypothetical protein
MRFLDVLAWNALAGALLGDLVYLPVAQRNLLTARRSQPQTLTARA